MMVVYALYGVAALIVLAPLAVALGASPRGTGVVYGASLIVTLTLGIIALLSLFGIADTSVVTLPLGLPWLGAHFRIDALARLLPGGRQSRRRGGQPVTRSAMAATRTRRSACCRSIPPFSPA